MGKQEIRREIRLRKRALTREEIEACSHAICRNFLRQPFYLDAPAIYPYVAYNQEIRTEEIIEDAWRRGKRVAVPRVEGENMTFYYITDFSQLAEGYQGIPEPVTQEAAEEQTALILMPGLAFDPSLNRIGYGGGYYDRYLDARRNRNYFKAALAYDFQLLEHVETEAHDYRLDALVLASDCILGAKTNS